MIRRIAAEGSKALVGNARRVLRRFAGEEAGLAALPLSIMRALVGDTMVISQAGNRLEIDLRDVVISGTLVFTRSYEPVETNFVRQVLKRGDLVIDVGANVGYYSLLAASCVGASGQVFAFEPSTRSFNILSRNIERNHVAAIVRAYNMACGEAPTTGHLYLNPFANMGDHRMYNPSLGSAREGRQKWTTIDVPIVRCDDYVPADIAVSFIKVDVQGFEPFALRGMDRILGGGDLPIVLAEFWPYGMRLAGADPEKFLRDMTERGFDILELGDDGLIHLTSATRLLAEYQSTRAFTNVVMARAPARNQRVSALMGHAYL